MHDTPTGPYALEATCIMLDVLVELEDGAGAHAGYHCLIGHSYAARHRVYAGRRWDSLEEARTFLWLPPERQLTSARRVARTLVGSDDAPDWLRVNGQHMVCRWARIGVTVKTWRGGTTIVESGVLP